MLIPPNVPMNENSMEARAGIEPACEDLQGPREGAMKTLIGAVMIGALLAGCSGTLPEVTFEYSPGKILCKRGETTVTIEASITSLISKSGGQDEVIEEPVPIDQETTEELMEACKKFVSFF